MIVHAIPLFMGPDRYASGTWKAIEAVKLSLDRIGRETRTVKFDGRHADELLDACTGETTDVLVEYSYWPQVLKRIRKQAGGFGLHVRTVNAEGFQHWAREGGSAFPTPKNMKLFAECLVTLRRDSRCKRIADTMLGISDWDNRHYWRLLPGRAEVKHMPYFSPWPFLRPQVIPVPWTARRNAVVCLASEHGTLGGRSMVNNFNVLADRIAGRDWGKLWEFELTKGWEWGSNDATVAPRVKAVGNVDEPWDLLCGVRAVAVLSSVGYGTKTTIVDGLAAGCHVLVHPVLARRLLPELRDLCIVCDPNNNEDIGRAISRLAMPPSDHGVNRELADRAAAALEETLE